MYIPNFSFLAQFGGEMVEEQHFFRSKGGGNPISPFLIDVGGWFLDMLYNFWFSIDWRKERTIFCDFDHLVLPFLNWGITEFWPQNVETPYKAHPALLFDIHNKIQLPSSIWRGIMRGTNSRNNRHAKTRTKNYRWYGAEKSRPPKGTSRALTKCTYLISTSSLNLEGIQAKNNLNK